MKTDSPEIILPGPWKPQQETIKYEVAITSMPAERNPTLTDTVSALLVPTIAVVALMVGLGQFLVNRARLKHELFDRRYAIFAATNDYIVHILNTDKIDHDTLIEFKITVRGARFIFDNKMEKHLKHILSKTIDLDMKRRNHREALDDNVRRELGNDIMNLVTYLTNQIENLDDKFEPFLGINK